MPTCLIRRSEPAPRCRRQSYVSAELTGPIIQGLSPQARTPRALQRPACPRLASGGRPRSALCGRTIDRMRLSAPHRSRPARPATRARAALVSSGLPRSFVSGMLSAAATRSARASICDEDSRTSASARALCLASACSGLPAAHSATTTGEARSRYFSRCSSHQSRVTCWCAATIRSRLGRAAG